MKHHGLRYKRVDPGLRARVCLLTDQDLEAPLNESSPSLPITMLLYTEAYHVVSPR